METVSISQDELAKLEKSRDLLKEENRLLREQVRFLKSRLFGRKTDQTSGESAEEQGQLFSGELEDVEHKVERVHVPAHKRKKPGRKPLPDHLPRVRVEHDLDEADKKCACGCEKTRIGEEVSEQLDYQPAKLKVIQHVRFKYACRACEGVESEDGAVSIAPGEPQIIEKSIATPGLLTEILGHKFIDALPFYRQEKHFQRMDVSISRATMCNWAMKIAQKGEAVLNLLKEQAKSSGFLQIDETRFLVMREKGRAHKKKSYMWVVRAGPPDKPIIVYHYDPQRSQQVAKDLLVGFQGYVQTDGYAAYDFLDAEENIVHVACFAHARRKFTDTIKASSKGAPHAETAVNFIRQLYDIEDAAKEAQLDADGIAAYRKEKAEPVLKAFKEWLEKLNLATPPKGLLGKAVRYTLKMWPRLIKYIESADLTPDNNRVENAIRPFVLGRKNWLISGHPEGARASAFFYSLIETAKANRWEPYSYLKFFLEGLRLGHDPGTLLPNNPPPELFSIG